MAMPERVTIVEVGPRDGLQNEAAQIPTDGEDRVHRPAHGRRPGVIEATSFVHPRAVPQLADADEVYPAISRASGVRYPVLVPTPRGLERAIAAGADEIAVVIGATDEFNRANLNRTVEEALADAAQVIGVAKEPRDARPRLRVGRVRLPVCRRGRAVDDGDRRGTAPRPRRGRAQPRRHDRRRHARATSTACSTRSSARPTSALVGLHRTTRAARRSPTSTRRWSVA